MLYTEPLKRHGEFAFFPPKKLNFPKKLCVRSQNFCLPPRNFVFALKTLPLPFSQETLFAHKALPLPFSQETLCSLTKLCYCHFHKKLCIRSQNFAIAIFTRNFVFSRKTFASPQETLYLLSKLCHCHFPKKLCVRSQNVAIAIFPRNIVFAPKTFAYPQ